MEKSVALFQGIAQGGAGGFGRLLGSVAGLLVIIAVLKSAFYIGHVGERILLTRNGKPITRRNGKYKVRKPGIGVKIPGYHGIEKVNVQEQSQRLPDITAECSDGQYRAEADLVFKYLCDEDDPEYEDYPALTIVKTKEPAQVFTSRCTKAFRVALEATPPDQRDDDKLLLQRMNAIIGETLLQRGITLLEVNIHSCARTSIQVAVDKFGPEGTPNAVAILPHQFVMTTALDGVA